MDGKAHDIVRRKYRERSQGKPLAETDLCHDTAIVSSTDGLTQARKTCRLATALICRKLPVEESESPFLSFDLAVQ